MQASIHILPRLRSLPLLLLLLSGSAAAQVAPMPDPAAYLAMNGGGGEARLEDAEASCEQLYAEARQLEQQIAALPKPADPGELARRMQANMENAQKSMMAGQRVRGVGSSLLAMVPGVGGMAASALGGLAGRASMDGLNKAMEKNMDEQQAYIDAAMAADRLHGRQQHVTNLFVSKGCRPSQLNRQRAGADARTLAGDKDEDDAVPAAIPVQQEPALMMPVDPSGPAVPGTPAAVNDEPDD